MPARRQTAKSVAAAGKHRLPEPGPAVPPDESYADAYNALVEIMELLSVRFSRASVASPSIFVAVKGKQLQPIIETDGRYLNFGSGFVAVASLSFRGQYPEEDEASVTAEAEIELVFRSPIPMTDDHFEIFKARNLHLYARPYFREFLHSAIARTGWPPYTLPPIAFQPPKASAPKLGGEGLSE